MTDAWYITDWDDLYEVNSDKGRWKAGQKKRHRPLDYVRLYVLGPAGDNVVYAEAAETAQEIAPDLGDWAWPCAWGFFVKALEIAARAKNPDHRGYLLGKGDSPSSPRSLRRLTAFTQTQIDHALAILSDPRIGWMELRPWPAVSASSANSASSPPLQEDESETEDEVEGKDESEGEGLGENAEPASPSDFSPPGDSFSPSASLIPPDVFAEAVIRELQIGKGDAKQLKADRTTFAKIAVRLNAGQLGEIKEAKKRLLTAAENIRQDPTVRNKAAAFTAFVKTLGSKT